MKRLVYINNGFVGNSWVVYLSMLNGVPKVVKLARRNSRAVINTKIAEQRYKESVYFFSPEGQIEDVRHQIYGTEYIIETLSSPDPGLEPKYDEIVDGVFHKMPRGHLAIKDKTFDSFMNRRKNASVTRGVYDDWDGIKDEKVKNTILDSDVIVRYQPNVWGYEFSREFAQESLFVYATNKVSSLLLHYLEKCYDWTKTGIEVYVMHNYPERKEELFLMLDDWIKEQRKLKHELEDNNIEHIVFNTSTQDWVSLGLQPRPDISEIIFKRTDRKVDYKIKIINEYLEYSGMQWDDLV